MGTKGKKHSNENMLVKCIKSPYRFLCKARDVYVRSMNGCAGGSAGSFGAMGYPGPCAVPRSYSTSSSRMSESNDEDIRELVRAASQRGLKTKINISEFHQSDFPTRKNVHSSTNNNLPRSFTVGFGRIDEDKALDFDDDIKMKNDSFYPRSRSYAVSSKRRTNLYA
ncbi:hypothetical protein C5167_024547 [Papaver somniferum]|uniref:Uncharacterized protein n=1 Tax=Papaver somniferum TaxID=3469 RepID=A0A4Y7JSL3_PAPSO|nr:uncharacterized protein LOC113278067 [Papaver somniferum]RZC62798.1 hypothetical protein C5167_024547 [Papaver somniferum]